MATKMPNLPDPALAPADQLGAIAREHLFVPTLERQHSDQLDFHDLPVWAVERALQAAFMAGLAYAAGRI